MNKNMRRRDFLKTVGVAGAALAGGSVLAGCSTKTDDTGSIEWNEEADVLVIGSGFAGLAAAIEVKLAGATVKILEKMAIHGGNSSINGGGMAAAGSPLQKELGIEDSPEKMLEDMLYAGLYLNHVDKARIVAEKSSEAVQWTIDYLGVEWRDQLIQFGGHSVPRSYQTTNASGSGIINKQLAKLKELGVTVETGRKMERFITNDEGRVIGIEILDNYKFGEESGESKYIKANKAVVLTSGGFGNDIKMRQQQDPRLTEELDCTNHSGATGEAMREALKLDAVPIQLSWIQIGPWASPDEKGFGYVPNFSVPAASPWGIMVDPETGQRFVNELTDRKRKADAIIEVGHPIINFCDSIGAEKAAPGVLKNALGKSILEFATLDDLASHYNIPVDALKETVNKYNSYVQNGNDPDFGKPIPPGAQPLTHPPYYAARIYPKVHHCMGGIMVNEDSQVVNLDNEIIPGLYAAGEVTGGTHGACRLGTVATTDCIVCGRIAGQKAANEQA